MAKSAPKRPQHLLTLDEVRLLAAACSRRAPTGIRNRALLLVMASSGLRVSEALGLLPRDYDQDTGTLRVQSGKNGKQRVVTIAMPEAVEALERWLDKRAALGINGRRRIFCTLQGGPMSRRYVAAFLPRLAEKAEIDKRVHAHGLRHFYAATLARTRCPVVHIQDALGHSSLHTTTVYLKRIAPEDTHDAVREAFARALE